jgi:hypothetical protein
MRPYLLKKKIGLVEWIKVKAMSSSPSTLKKGVLKKFYYRGKAMTMTTMKQARESHNFCAHEGLCQHKAGCCGRWCVEEDGCKEESGKGVQRAPGNEAGDQT